MSDERALGIAAGTSSGVTGLIGRARAMQDFIWQQVPREIARSHKIEVVSALFSLALEHHRSILSLLETGANTGSSFGLARPLLDAAYRAHWTYACATPEQLAAVRAGDDQAFPGLGRMADEVEARLNADGLFTGIRPYINALHGFTHGGLEQIARRFNANGDLQPSFHEGEIDELVRATTAHVVALAIAFCQLTSQSPQDEEPRSKAVADRYVEAFGRLA